MIKCFAIILLEFIPRIISDGAWCLEIFLASNRCSRLTGQATNDRSRADRLTGQVYRGLDLSPLLNTCIDNKGALQIVSTFHLTFSISSSDIFHRTSFVVWYLALCKYSAYPFATLKMVRKKKTIKNFKKIIFQCFSIIWWKIEK